MVLQRFLGETGVVREELSAARDEEEKETRMRNEAAKTVIMTSLRAAMALEKKIWGETKSKEVFLEDVKCV